MKKKMIIPIELSNRIINAGSVILLSATHNRETTISTIAWHMPVSKFPNLIALSISKKGYSLELLSKSGEFCINLPDISMFDAVKFCGSHSGRDIDKFEETGLTPLECKQISTFYIDECLAHMECKLHKIDKLGDHTIVIGEVLTSYIDDAFFNNDSVIDVENVSLIHHFGGNHFGTLIKQ